MALQEDTIVDIPETRVRYFGTRGKMLLPSQATVAALIRKIPKHKLMTTDILRRELAAQFRVQGTCPVTIKKALHDIVNETGNDAPYWRVIKQRGELMAYFPGGMEGHANRLRAEGFTIDTSRRGPRVHNFRASLVRFN